jgi:hypothetical protein
MYQAGTGINEYINLKYVPVINIMVAEPAGIYLSLLPAGKTCIEVSG